MAGARVETIAAGRFGDWVVGMQQALRDGTSSDVPCGTCTACCESGQVIHIEPDEATTLAVLPPGLVGADLALRPDAEGRCPMLVRGSCSIYEHRPRICRTYDCRIFPAAGVSPDTDKPAIAERAGRWRFELDTLDDRARHDATRMAATAIRLAQLGGRPTSATQLAAQAVLAHDDLLT